MMLTDTIIAEVRDAIDWATRKGKEGVGVRLDVLTALLDERDERARDKAALVAADKLAALVLCNGDVETREALDAYRKARRSRARAGDGRTGTKEGGGRR